jgi:hypothetical protein
VDHLLTYILIIGIGRIIGNNEVQSLVKSIYFRYVSLRNISLIAFYISMYKSLSLWLSDTLTSVMFLVQFPWLKDLLVLAGACTLPLIIFRAIPSWLAWYICRPLGLYLPSRFFFWFTLGTGKNDLKGFNALLRASFGFPPLPSAPEDSGMKERKLKLYLQKRKPLPLHIDEWTIAALALEAEVHGDFDKAKQLIHSFELCPPRMRTSGLLRRFAFEELAWHAAKRGDWEEVRRRALMGGRRGMHLLKLLATGKLSGKMNRAALWLAWLISPEPWRTFQYVLSAQKVDDQPNAFVRPYECPEPGVADPLRTHLSLLQKASEGALVSMEEVFLLTRMCDGELVSQRVEELLRRGMELGARDVLSIVEKLKSSLLDELEELAAIADGKIPDELSCGLEEAELSCITELQTRLRNRLYNDVSRAQEMFQVDKDMMLSDEDLLERWQIWLGLREATSRLHLLLGTDELAALWYGGLRLTVWNSPTYIFNSCGKRVAWISIIMFYWVSQISELLDDEEGKTVNLKNMKVCGYSHLNSYLSNIFSRISSPFRRLAG